MAQQKKLLLVTAAWGDWHVSKHVDINVPTLLADGNFPALSAHCEITYLIYTSQPDLERMRRAPALQGLSRFAKIEFRLIAADKMQDPIATHHKLWAKATEQAIKEQSFILNMPPDAAWSNGSFRHVGHMLEAGKKAIFMTYLRAESESFAAAIRGYRQSNSDAISISGAQLVDICLHALHPLMAAYMRNSDHFPKHPEMMLWAVPPDGVLCRVLAREMFAYDPAIIALNSQSLLSTHIDPALIHVIDDSDDLFAVSLAPLTKDSDWYSRPRMADPYAISDWWLDYDSWVNDLLVGTKLRWHCRPVRAQAWRARETGADIFLRRAAAIREGRKLWRIVRSLACTTVARLLATAIQTGAISQIASGRGGAIVFVPINNAFSECPENLIDRLHDGAGKRDLVRIMRRHFVPNEDPVMPMALEERLRSSGDIKLSAADRTTLRIVVRDGRLEVNGVRILGASISSGMQRVYLVERLLAPLEKTDATITSVPAFEETRAQ